MRKFTLAAVLLAGAALSVAPVKAEPASDVPAAVQDVRRHVFDADINTLTFHNMDEIFPTRRVARSGDILPLPRREQPMPVTYRFGGGEYSVEDGLVRTATNAILVLKDGKIVYEKYLNLTNEDTRFIIWSCTKSITSLLIGIAIDEGSISSIDDRIVKYVPELKGTAFETATIRNVLEMRSGADWDERYDFGANPSPAAKAYENALVRNVSRYADAARVLKSAHKPGTSFNYSTVDTAVLGWLLERATKHSIEQYTAEKLWSRLGAEADGFYIADGAPGVGRAFNGAGFNATLRDLGRLGQMVLEQGKAGGQQVVPAAWIAESTRPYTTGAQPEGPLGYGYQWWTVKGRKSFSALGLQGQSIYIDPETRTVVVKLSYYPPASETHGAETAAMLQAISDWTPAQ